jgi:hypothetical protein
MVAEKPGDGRAFATSKGNTGFELSRGAFAQAFSGDA